MEFSAEPESSCISASGEEAVTSEENGNDFYKLIKAWTLEKILISPLTDGFVGSF